MLMGHLRTHTGGKPHQCCFCHRPFSSKSDLLNHERSHTGENPFVCNICDKAFSVKSNLMKHVKAHTVEKEKPFQCGNCENTFLDEIC